jgi:hypothetical protein
MPSNMSKDLMVNGSIEIEEGFSKELEAAAAEHLRINGMLTPRGLEASILKQDGSLDFMPIVQVTMDAQNHPGNDTMVLADSLVGTSTIVPGQLKGADTTLRNSIKNMSRQGPG